MTASDQLDLFAAPPAERCGLCVHRNGFIDAERGGCTPVGQRLASDPPCPWYFGREQLAAGRFQPRVQHAA